MEAAKRRCGVSGGTTAAAACRRIESETDGRTAAYWALVSLAAALTAAMHLDQNRIVVGRDRPLLCWVDVLTAESLMLADASADLKRTW